MTDHKIGTCEEWFAARLELLKAEKELTRRSDELAQWRQKLHWVRIDKELGLMLHSITIKSLRTERKKRGIDIGCI